MPEIEKADPIAQKTARVIVLAGALLGATFMLVYNHYRGTLLDWLLADPARLSLRVRLIFVWSIFILAGPLLLLAVNLWRLGERTNQAERFPPPGLRLVRDTKVLQGNEALGRGRLLKILGVGLAAAMLFLLFSLWRLAGILIK